MTTTVVETPLEPPAPPPSSPPTTFADLYEDVNTGVALIEPTTCGEASSGTGFLISPRLVATAAHVVADSASLTLTFGDAASETLAGTVVGMDIDADVALVLLSGESTGHLFSIAHENPRVGVPVAALGFPERKMSFSQGVVSGVNFTDNVGGIIRHGMLLTDAPLNPGNSGGPLVTLEGDVVGLADAVATESQSRGLAVSAEVANKYLDSWKSNTQSVTDAPCAFPVGPDTRDTVVEGGDSGDSEPTVVALEVLAEYYTAINAADYETVARLLINDKRSAEEIRVDLVTSRISNAQLVSAAMQPTGEVLAHVTFTSTQDAEHAPGDSGLLCVDWELDYHLSRDGSGWSIERALPHGKPPGYSSC